MKRHEQNMVMKEKILNCALEEFSEKEYEKASMNRICSKGKISKGIIYHYFQDKEALYLECVFLCFDKIIEYYTEHGFDDIERLDDYMMLRMNFFKDYPLYQNLFFHIILDTPDHLINKVNEIKKQFDYKNQIFYHKFLSKVELKENVTFEKAIQFIDLVQYAYNHSFRQDLLSGKDFNEVVKNHEFMISGWIHMMLYGIIKEKR